VRVAAFCRYIDLIFYDFYIYEFSYKLELFTNSFSLIIFLVFFKKIFASEVSGIMFKVIVIVSGIFIAVEIISPLWLSSDLVYINHIVFLASGIWILYMSILALVRKRSDSIIMFLGVLFLFFALILEIIITFLPRIHVPIIHIGLIGFLFSQSITLSRRFTSLYKTAQHLSCHLQKEVAEQTKIIRQKNEELVRLNREKTDYFVNLAHETKTPPTLILN
jgi:signal transduction histidine kinase